MLMGFSAASSSASRPGRPAGRALGLGALLLLLRPGARAQPGLGEVDVSDLIGLGGRGGSLEPKAIEDTWPAGVRRQRMLACVRAAARWTETHPSELEGVVAELMAQAESQAAAQPGAQFTEEQAMNQYVFGMTMSCYHIIDESIVYLAIEGERLPADAEETLFGKAAAPPRPTRAQFELLEAVMREEQARRMEDRGPEALGGLHIIGSWMSRRQKAAYLLLVVAVVAAAGYCFFTPLIFPPEQMPRERTAKAAKKVKRAAVANGVKKRRCELSLGSGM